MPVNVSRIDHVGVIVADLEQACSLLRDVLGLSEGDRVERPNLRSAFFACSGVEIELVEILDPDERRTRLGDGEARIEHVALEVDDLDATYAALAALGVGAKAPPRAVERYRTFFTTPETTEGIGFQFVQSVCADVDVSRE